MMTCALVSTSQAVFMRWRRPCHRVAVPLALMMHVCFAGAAQQASAPAQGAAVASGAASGAASAADDGASAPGGKGAVTVAETGLAALQFKRTPIKFGSQPVGSTSAVRTVTLEADPAASAAATYEARVSGEFTVVPAKCEVAAKGSCALSVAFSPTKVGDSSSAIVLSDAKGGPTRVVADLAGEGVGSCEARRLGACTGWWAVLPVGLLALFYLFAVIVARWNMVARPARELLVAEIDAVEARVEALAGALGGTASGAAALKALLKLARAQMHSGNRPMRFLDVLFWSRGQEDASWQLVHEVKEQLAASLPPEDLRVALEDAEVQLRQAAGPEAVALADRIRAELARTLLDVADYPGALLRETLVFLQRAAGDAIADVAAVVDPSSSAKAADMAALAGRLVNALAPQAVLSTQLEQALKNGMPAEYRVLVKHACDVLLPQAASMRNMLSVAPDDKGEPELRVAWRSRLDVFRKDFLAPAEAFRKRIELALAAAPLPPIERRVSLLREARNQLYDATDTEFASIASWHKKTVWLVASAMLLITALSATLGHAVFFLLGALGGLMSRLSRVLVRQQLPTDYGFSWTTLFLSPTVGALAGWAGVLLVTLAVKLKLLGDFFVSVSWGDSYSELALGLALVFGFSERVFVTIIGGVEGKLGVVAGGATADSGTAKGGAATPLAITTPVTLPNAAPGVDYQQDLIATGGTSPYTWSKTQGDLPDGLTLGKDGSLRGKPVTVGPKKFTLVVKDGAGATCERAFTLTIAA